MNFGNLGFIELIFLLLVWGVPIALVVWFVRTLTAMSLAVREIADRLASVERAIRDATIVAPPNER